MQDRKDKFPQQSAIKEILFSLLRNRRVVLCRKEREKQTSVTTNAPGYLV